MYPDLARLVSAGRAARGIDQAALAQEIGVGQQTVSRWEMGERRPRPESVARLAAALDLDLAQLRRACGYAVTEDDQSSLPVQPLAPALPFHELSPDRFEDISTEIVQAMHPDGRASRYGGQGEKQSGIDVLVAGPTTTTVQCKRQMQFGPQDIRDAVAAQDVEATTRYLFLSRPLASAGARAEAKNHLEWELWDGHDLSRFIRTRMAPDAALRLVDTYFPGHRKAFLGIDPPNVWEDIDAFYALNRGENFFRHDWELVGRDNQVDAAVQALQDDKPVVEIVGRGGLGKTRLLRAIAERVIDEGWTVRFLRGSQNAGPADFELLPRTGKLLLVLDDVHERQQSGATILATARQYNPGAQILASIRPYGKSQFGTDLRQVGLGPDESPEVRLDDLSQSDAEALAREALQGTHEQLVPKLAQLTRDCPLATVVGGVLVRQGRLDPNKLELDESLRDTILDGFRKAVIADAIASDQQVRGDILDAMAAIQPFQTDNEEFQTALSALVGVPWDRCVKQLRSLEDSGVLLRRDQALRLIPDMLGDVTLATACYEDRSRTDSGYLRRVLTAANDSATVVQNLFVNASRIDWQIQQQDDTAPSIADGLWKRLRSDLEASDLAGRSSIMRLLKRVALFQPERSLELVDWHLRHPTHDIAEERHALARLYPPTWRGVQNESTSVLRAIAYHGDFLESACQLLWDLALEDSRPTNQFPEHPLRVLQDLAEYGTTKPLWFNEAILNVATTWFSDDAAISPFTVLAPLLATEGNESRSENYSINFRPFSINAESVGGLRQQVIDLAFIEARSPNLGRAAAAVDAIDKSLTFPHGMFGRVVSLEEKAPWIPGMVSTIERLRELMAWPDLDPALAVAILNAVHWHAVYATESPETTDEAIRLWDSPPGTTAFEVAFLVHDGWGQLDRNRGQHWEEAQRQHEARLGRAADRLLTEQADPDAVLLIEHRIAAYQEAFPANPGASGPLVAKLVEKRTTFARAAIERMIARPTSPLRAVLPVITSSLAAFQSDELIAAAEALLLLDDLEISRCVAQGIGWNRGPRTSLIEGELDLLRSFAQHADPGIRSAVIFATRRLAEGDLLVALELWASIPFVDSSWLAGEFFSPFVLDDSPFRLDVLSRAQLDHVTDQLIELKDLGSYGLQSFLARLSDTDPDRVASLFIKRIEHAESLESLSGYQPVPFSFDVPLRIRTHKDGVPVLRHIRDWVAAGSTWQRQHFGADLFAAAAGPFDTPLLSIFSETFGSADPSWVTSVATLLREAPRTVALDHVPFVIEALDAAAKLGPDQETKIAEALYVTLVTGVRSGAPGQPFPQDVEMRDKCRQIAQALPAGSPARRFYEKMVKVAERSIEREIADDRPTDGRDW